MQNHNVWTLSDTDLFTVRDTAYSGRAVFANRDIEPGCTILTSTPEISPIAHVILRPYRRETCAQCFAYDRGREWKNRNVNAGVAFCSESCESKWKQEASPGGLQAHESVEGFIKQQQRRLASNPVSLDGDVDMDGADEGDGNQSKKKLAPEVVDAHWQDALDTSALILASRTEASPSKGARKAQRKAMEAIVDVDVPHYLLSGVLTAFRAAQKRGLDHAPVSELIPSLVALVGDDDVFATPASLFGYVQGYLLLLAVLPVELLPFVEPQLCRELASRAAHNAFSIRPAADGEQSGEFLGWGVWPEASMCNHSCSPNVRKERRGRIWHFIADGSPGAPPIRKGDELCITYLGGDEKDFDVYERWNRLKYEWGFKCQCARCILEAPSSEVT